MKLFGGKVAGLANVSDDVQGTQQAGDQKGQQGKNGEEFELKAGTQVCPSRTG
jgi:hypothetical protein